MRASPRRLVSVSVSEPAGSSRVRRRLPSATSSASSAPRHSGRVGRADLSDRPPASSSRSSVTAAPQRQPRARRRARATWTTTSRDVVVLAVRLGERLRRRPRGGTVQQRRRRVQARKRQAVAGRGAQRQRRGAVVGGDTVGDHRHARWPRRTPSTSRRCCRARWSGARPPAARTGSDTVGMPDAVVHPSRPSVSTRPSTARRRSRRVVSSRERSAAAATTRVVAGTSPSARRCDSVTWSSSPSACCRVAASAVGRGGESSTSSTSSKVSPPSRTAAAACTKRARHAVDGRGHLPCRAALVDRERTTHGRLDQPDGMVLRQARDRHGREPVSGAVRRPGDHQHRAWERLEQQVDVVRPEVAVVEQHEHVPLGDRAGGVGLHALGDRGEVGHRQPDGEREGAVHRPRTRRLAADSPEQRGGASASGSPRDAPTGGRRCDPASGRSRCRGRPDCPAGAARALPRWAEMPRRRARSLVTLLAVDVGDRESRACRILSP